jgi:cyclohexanecarboxylate-CoA ligase
VSILAATFEHPMAARWWAPTGPWPATTLDDLLAPDPQTEARVADVAGGLAAAGVARGSTVCWQRPNGHDADALYRACWRLGAVAAPIHHLTGPAEVDARLARLSPATFVAPDDALPTGVAVTRGSQGVDPADLAVALATAGSTGTPKLALHTHRALAYKARLMAGVHRLGPDDCTLTAAPLAHISGLLNGVLLTACGMRSVPMARWDASEAVAVIERERVTFMIGPPTFFVSLLRAPDFDPARVRSLRQISCGGAGVTPAFVRSTAEALGCRVKRTYGSTEAPTVTTSTLTDDEHHAAETDGRPVGAAEVRVDCGELLVRGPELFVGYDDPVATAAAFTDDGWFRTGDLATIDADGWVTVVGRRKDVIIRGGENIAPAEVEAVLESHPAVSQAAAVGEPDARLGERVCAFVVAGSPFDLDECRRWFASNGVTRFKWPERVVQVDALPLLPAGKPDRTALRALL